MEVERLDWAKIVSSLRLRSCSLGGGDRARAHPRRATSPARCPRRQMPASPAPPRPHLCHGHQPPARAMGERRVRVITLGLLSVPAGLCVTAFWTPPDCFQGLAHGTWSVCLLEVRSTARVLCAPPRGGRPRAASPGVAVSTHTRGPPSPVGCPHSVPHAPMPKCRINKTTHHLLACYTFIPLVLVVYPADSGRAIPSAWRGVGQSGQEQIRFALSLEVWHFNLRFILPRSRGGGGVPRTGGCTCRSTGIGERGYLGMVFFSADEHGEKTRKSGSERC